MYIEGHPRSYGDKMVEYANKMRDHHYVMQTKRETAAKLREAKEEEGRWLSKDSKALIGTCSLWTMGTIIVMSFLIMINKIKNRHSVKEETN